VSELYEYAMKPEHIGSTDPNIFDTTITDTGALSASSGLRTGRSPKDKRVVEDEVTKNVSSTHLISILDHLVGKSEHPSLP
jgi:ATP-dependent phosphoenolpyruvate carboxykinase